MTSIYVGYPKLAQDNVNKSTLHVTSESILTPASDAFDLDLRSELETTSKYHPQLDGFDASLFLEGSDVPFISFTTTGFKATNGSRSQVQQRVPIKNMTEFTRYTMTVLGSDKYSFSLRGTGGLKQGGLPHTNVDYNQKVEMQGL